MPIIMLMLDLTDNSLLVYEHLLENRTDLFTFSEYLDSYLRVVFGVTILVILIFEPMGLNGRWLKMRLYFRNWPFR